MNMVHQGQRRHEDFIKDQKMQAAENAITDKYASAMIPGGVPGNHRGMQGFMTNHTDGANENGIVGSGIAGIAAMS
jgi:hypothetical protein